MLILLLCSYLGDCQQKNKQAKTLGAISLGITVNNVSSNFYNGFGVFYNGSISVVASGGTQPYTFSIVGQYQQSNGYFTFLLPGVYQVEVTDATGQKIDTTVTVGSVYPIPAVRLTNIKVPSTCGSYDGSFTAIGSGGTPPYTYSLDGGLTFSSNSVFSNLGTGDYTCILKDANGLLATAQIISHQYYFDSLIFDCKCCNFYATAGPGSPGICTKNSGIVGANATGGTPPYFFSMDSINFFPGYAGWAGGYMFTNLGAGTYKVYAKDSKGNVSVATTEIALYCDVSINYVSVDASCGQQNGSITVHVTNGSPPYSYTIDGVSYQSDSTFSGLGVGRYNVGVRDASGKINSIFATVFDKCPVVTARATNDSCNQKKASITATGQKGTRPYLFSLNGVTFQTDSVFSGLGAGNYTVTLKDANGFTSNASITVKNNCLSISLSQANTTCGNKNGSITGNVSNGTVPYAYSIDGLHFQVSNQFNNLVAGNYTITAKDSAGMTATASAILTDQPAPQVSVATAPASCTNTNGSIRISTKGGTSPFQFSIDNGQTWHTDSIFNNLDSTRYFTIIRDANACLVSDTVQLTAYPTPSVFIGNDTTVCTGDTILLTIPQQAGYSYAWQDSSRGNLYRVTTTGTYTLKVTNQYGCSASSSINVKFRPLPAFSLGKDTSLCNGRTFQLQPQSFVQGAFLWNTGSTVSALTISSPGLYWLQVSDSGCFKRDTINVSYKPIPIINLGNDTTLCESQTLLLNVSNNNSIYLWQDNSTNPTYLIKNAGNYSVIVSENGCDTSGNLTVTYETKPIIYVIKDTTLCVTEQLVLDASYPNSTYLWQDGSRQPQYIVSKAGIYAVQVTNTCGTVSDSSIVKYDNCACKFFVPSAFTPNGDGKNDIFYIKYLCIFSNYDLKIFNRWGQLLFASKDPSRGWDGTYSGNPQPVGTYVWELSYKDDITGKNMHQNGTVILIR